MKKAVNFDCSDGGSGKTLTATRKLTVSVSVSPFFSSKL